MSNLTAYCLGFISPFVLIIGFCVYKRLTEKADHSVERGILSAFHRD